MTIKCTNDEEAKKLEGTLKDRYKTTIEVEKVKPLQPIFFC